MQAKSFVRKQCVNKFFLFFFDRGGGYKSLFLNSFLLVLNDLFSFFLYSFQQKNEVSANHHPESISTSPKFFARQFFLVVEPISAN